MNKKLIMFSIILLSALPIFSQSEWKWQRIADMNCTRMTTESIAVDDQKILVVGGTGFNKEGKPIAIKTAEILDSVTRQWRYTASMNVPREGGHKLIKLDNGKVLLVGGFSTGFSTRSCEIFDPVTESWSFTDSTVFIHKYGVTLTRLPDGRLLLAGGDNAPDKCEIYDQATGKWKATGSLNTKRWGHSAVLLNDGKVLVAGGQNMAVKGEATSSCEVFDPATETWSYVDSMIYKRFSPAMVILPNGTVFVSGGWDWIHEFGSMQQTESWNPNENKWIERGLMQSLRARHFMTIRNNGNIFIAGSDLLNHNGTQNNPDIYVDKINSQLTDSYEEFDPSSFSTLSVKLMDRFVRLMSYTELSNDRIIRLGGYEINDNSLIEPVSFCYIYDSTNVIVSVPDKIKSKEEFYLYNNYPNPFNPSTVIAYSLPKEVTISIKIFNSLGKEITTLFSGKQYAGSHKVTFNASNLPSGVYFCRIQSPDFSKSIKMLLIK